MADEFKYLVNPTNKEHSFQHNGTEYTVPPQSRRLLNRTVAEHGEKRSYCLTDPEFDAAGNPIKTGNDILKRCHLEDAETVNPVGLSEPIVIEKSRNKPEDLLVENSLLKPLVAKTIHPAIVKNLPKTEVRRAPTPSTADESL